MSNKEMDKGIKVIQFTRVATWVMIVCTLVAEAIGYSICKWAWSIITIMENESSLIANTEVAFAMFVAIFYLATFCAHIILFNMLKLLKNMKANKVFIKENTSLMRNMSYASIAIFALCFIGMLVWSSLLFIGVIGLFMGLVVQCVRIVMDNAIDMRDELDLTV